MVELDALHATVQQDIVQEKRITTLAVKQVRCLYYSCLQTSLWRWYCCISRRMVPSIFLQLLIATQR